MSRRRRLAWFTFGARGASRRKLVAAAARRRRRESEQADPWVVYLVDRIDHDGARLLGLTLFDRHEIEIDAGQEFDELCHTLVHEMLHAFGGDAPTDDVARLAEELFIGRCEARAWSALTEMGLRVPDLPPKFDALRSRAIAMQKGAA